KMVHAQRLLPLEELLSGQSVAAKSAPRAVAPAVVKKSAPTVSSRAAEPERESSSPFETDRARKGRNFEMAGGPAVASDASVKSTMVATAAAVATVIAIAEEKASSS